MEDDEQPSKLLPILFGLVGLAAFVLLAFMVAGLYPQSYSGTSQVQYDPQTSNVGGARTLDDWLRFVAGLVALAVFLGYVVALLVVYLRPTRKGGPSRAALEKHFAAILAFLLGAVLGILSNQRPIVHIHNDAPFMRPNVPMGEPPIRGQIPRAQVESPTLRPA